MEPLQKKRRIDSTHQRLPPTGGRTITFTDHSSPSTNNFTRPTNESIAGWEPPESADYALDNDSSLFDAEIAAEVYESGLWGDNVHKVPVVKRSKTSVCHVYIL